MFSSFQVLGMDSWAGLTASLAAGEALTEARGLDENRNYFSCLRLRFFCTTRSLPPLAVVAVADISQTGAFSLCQAADGPSHSQKVLLPHLCTVCTFPFGEHKELSFQKQTKNVPRRVHCSDTYPTRELRPCPAAWLPVATTPSQVPRCRPAEIRLEELCGEEGERRGGEGRSDSARRLQISLSFISEHRGPAAPNAAVCQQTDVAGSPSIIGGSAPRISAHLRMETMELIWSRQSGSPAKTRVMKGPV